MSFEKTWNKTWYSTASEVEQQEFRSWMTGLLQNERVNICFTKVDGSERWIHATLKPEYLPQIVESDSTKPARKVNVDSKSVWDIDKKEWRSFRWDSIQQFSFNLGG